MSPDFYPIDPERFDRYLTGACSPEERAAVEALLARYQEGKAIADAAQASVDRDGLWSRFTESSWYDQAQIVTTPVAKPSTLASATRSPSTSRISYVKRARQGWKYTTGLALAGLAVVAIAVQGTIHSSVETGEFTTRRAEQLTVTLPNGASAILAPESRLYYSTGGRGTEIELYGQAYFTVNHDAERPFSVRARGVVTQVLGTAFDIRAYDDEQTVEVAVVSGKVSSGAKADAYVLTPGMITSSVLLILHWPQNR